MLLLENVEGLGWLIARTVAVTVGVWCLRWIINPSWGRKYRLPPGFMGIPFVGDTFAFLTDQAVGLHTYKLAKYGPIFKSWLYGEPHIFVGGQQAVTKLLNAEHELVEVEWDHATRKLMGPFAVAVVTGADHVALRKLVLPSFSISAIASYVPGMVAIAESCCKSWAEEGDVSAYVAAKAYTFEIALKLILGFDASLITPVMTKRCSLAFAKWEGGLFKLPINLPGFAYHKALGGKREIFRIIQQNLDLHRSRAKAGTSPNPSDVRTFGEMLMEVKDRDGKPMSDAQLQDLFLNLMFAGHDTSAATLLMLFRDLALHPEVMQKLRAEQAQVREDHGSAITDAALRDMKYADAVIKEALRRTPIVKHLIRRAIKSFEVDGYLVPKGWKVLLMVWNVLETDARWVNETGPLAPDNFCPERWLAEGGQKVGGWIPFGSGPSMCLGYRLALAEMKVLLAVLARGYEWTLHDPEEKIDTVVLPKPAKGLFTKFRKRSCMKDADILSDPT
ncbi:hypothetical protein WJX72_002103 [[Myrmecia] bisecta]|uniref:Cytochrome P450 n=1 Tax=[Myrmecia] bisecta TaxID=41462 RepID=A0AAW1R592_9CHLO